MTAETTRKTDQDYIPIRIDTMSNDEQIDFDLFTREGGRYFLFCAANSNFRKGDLSQTYIERTKYLYIKNEHHTNYRKYVERHLPSILTNDKIVNEEKVDLIYDVSNSMIQEAYSGSELPQKERVQDFIGNVMDFMFSKKLRLSEIIRFAEHDFYTYNHSLHVFIYSTMFSSFLKIREPSLIQGISQGSFLHDIGKSMVSWEIINKPAPLDQDEWKEMQMHPVYGRKIAEEKMQIVDPVILSIILNHHERLDGMGYPSHATELSVGDKIVGIADTYDAITSNRSYQMARKPFDALKYMMQTQAKKLDLDLLQKFAIMLGSK